MKKVYLLLLFVFGFSAFAQQKGISYQAVIINPNAVAAPGYNGTSIPLANKAICLSFKIVNSANQVEYHESQSITTDGYGMVNVVIGTGTAGTGLVSTLEAVAWNQGNKKLVVGVNTDGVCSNYTEISNQVLNYTPYSFYAQNADIKDGYVTTAKLADGAVTDPKVAMGINPAKVGLGNVNNTSDVNKPVSTATQTALDSKANSADVTTSLALKENLSNKSSDIVTDATSTTKYPTVKAIKDYVDANSNSGTGTIVDADANTKGKIQLAGDLAGTADLPTVPGLALKANTTDVTTSLASKEDVSNKSNATLGTSTTLYPTQNAVKAYVDTAITGATIVDADTATKGKIKLAGDLAGTADLPTVPGLALKANTTDVTTSLASKEDVSNKSNATLGTSTTLYPTQNAVKAYVDTAITGATIVDADTATKGKIKLAGDLAGTADLPTVPGLALKANTTDVTTSLASKEDVSNKSNATLGTSTTLYPTQNAVKAYVDTAITGATIVDADTATKGKIKLAGDLSGTADAPIIPGLALKANTTDVTTSLALKANLASPTFTGTVSGIDKTMVGLTNVDNTTDADKPVSTATQTALNLKANFASPTFTGTVTAPIYASTPQTLTDATTIAWDPANGLNANVTLGGNRILSFTTTPTAGSYGTLVVTQDATGGRTITLPSTANKVLGSTSTTTIALSSAANAKDILNFYYDGTNCYWNIGQGYGTAATSGTTNLASSVTGTLAVANGGTGATTLTGILKGTGTSALTAAIAGTDYLAPTGSAASLTNFPTLNQNTTGNAATVTTNANLTGDITSVGNNATVIKINGTSLAGLSTGVLKNTTSTGVPTIAIAGTDYQAPLTLTTSGTGAATLSGTTLNIPTVSIGDLKFVTNLNNIGVGGTTTLANATGGDNVAVGRNALGSYYTGGISGGMNIGIGTDAGDYNKAGARNIYVGAQAGITNETGNDNTFIGYNTATSIVRTTRNSISNSTAIGANAVVTTSNKIQLGDTSITNVGTSGTVTAGTVTYPNIHNSTAGQVLTVNAAGIASWATPASSAGTAHYVGEVYGGGIVFYITPGGFHGLIAETINITNTSPAVLFDYCSDPAYHNTDKGGNLYMDWRLPTFSELRLLYAARSTAGLNLSNLIYISSSLQYDFQYKALNFSNNTQENVNGDWTPRLTRPIRSF